MTSPQDLILQLQNLLTNASGADLQQFLAGLEQPGPAPAGDDLTPDGRIKVAMPSKNGTTTPQWCERVAIALQRANAPIYNLAGSPVYITDDGKTVYLNPNNFISAAEKYICPCAFRSKDDSTLVYQPMKEPLAKLFFLPEETELAIRTSASRMLLVGTAQIAAKATRDSQGVAVVTLKKNQTIASVVPADTLELANPHRYRVRSLPATGALIRAEDEGEQMSLL